MRVHYYIVRQDGGLRRVTERQIPAWEAILSQNIITALRRIDVQLMACQPTRRATGRNVRRISQQLRQGGVTR